MLRADHVNLVCTVSRLSRAALSPYTPPATMPGLPALSSIDQPEAKMGSINGALLC